MRLQATVAIKPLSESKVARQAIVFIDIFLKLAFSFIASFSFARDSMLKKDLTPDHLRCIGGSCPAVYQLEDGNLAIIGKRAPAELDRELQGKVAEDEYVVVLSPEFFQNLPTRT